MVIRHAVSIDERYVLTPETPRVSLSSQSTRRAKFRSDLISDAKAAAETKRHRHHHHGHHHHEHTSHEEKSGPTAAPKEQQQLVPPSMKTDRFRRRSQVRPIPQSPTQLYGRPGSPDDARRGTRPTRKDMQRMRSLSPTGNHARDGSASLHSAHSVLSFAPPTPNDAEYEPEEMVEQDIEELWYSPHLSWMR